MTNSRSALASSNCIVQRCDAAFLDMAGRLVKVIDKRVDDLLLSCVACHMCIVVLIDADHVRFELVHRGLQLLDGVLV